MFAKRGYEGTSTASIARRAGTSQSQLVKHFTNKQGILEAIFQYSWECINPAVSLAIKKIPSPTERLKTTANMVLSFMENDEELRTIFLLEGRRIRGDGLMVVLVPGFLEFIEILDGILKEMAVVGELLPHISPQAYRSGLMGAFEGMLRDDLLRRASKLPATYSEEDVRVVFATFLSSCLAK